MLSDSPENVALQYQIYMCLNHFPLSKHLSSLQGKFSEIMLHKIMNVTHRLKKINSEEVGLKRCCCSRATQPYGYMLKFSTLHEVRDDIKKSRTARIF